MRKTDEVYGRLQMVSAQAQVTSTQGGVRGVIAVILILIAQIISKVSATSLVLGVVSALLTVASVTFLVLSVIKLVEGHKGDRQLKALLNDYELALKEENEARNLASDVIEADVIRRPS